MFKDIPILSLIGKTCLYSSSTKRWPELTLLNDFCCHHLHTVSPLWLHKQSQLFFYSSSNGLQTFTGPQHANAAHVVFIKRALTRVACGHRTGRSCWAPSTAWLESTRKQIIGHPVHCKILQIRLDEGNHNFSLSVKSPEEPSDKRLAMFSG